MKEYMIKIWGGAWNDDANPSIKKDLGIDKGEYYFSRKEDLDEFMEKLKPYRHLGLAHHIVEGELTHKDTVAVMDLVYKGIRYSLEYNFGKEYEKESAEFMFFDGNYSCDCNKSLFIQRYCDEKFPELGCGDEIEIENFRIECR